MAAIHCPLHGQAGPQCEIVLEIGAAGDVILQVWPWIYIEILQEYYSGAAESGALDMPTGNFPAPNEPLAAITPNGQNRVTSIIMGVVLVLDGTFMQTLLRACYQYRRELYKHTSMWIKVSLPTLC